MSSFLFWAAPTARLNKNKAHRIRENPETDKRKHLFRYWWRLLSGCVGTDYCTKNQFMRLYCDCVETQKCPLYFLLIMGRRDLNSENVRDWSVSPISLTSIGIFRNMYCFFLLSLFRNMTSMIIWLTKIRACSQYFLDMRKYFALLKELQWLLN